MRDSAEKRIVGEQMTEAASALRWHYGPTASDPEPGRMWCYDCGSEVWFIEGGAICSGCKRSDDDAGHWRLLPLSLAC